MVGPSRLEDYLFTHISYVSPDLFKEKINITPYSITDDGKQFIFVVSDEDDDVYNTHIFPFALLGSYLCAKKLLIVPMESLHQLADKIGDSTYEKVNCY